MNNTIYPADLTALYQAIDNRQSASNHPLIGISANYREGDSCIENSYALSILEAGGVPVLIPVCTDIEILRETVKRLDGLLLTGGGDINPLFAKEDPIPQLQEYNIIRDQYDFTLVKLATDRCIPIFGICRGHQVINLAFGGNNYQDIYSQRQTPTLKHSQSVSREYGSHTVLIEKESLLFNIMGTDSIVVNSFHHQAIKDVAPGFHVSATSPDGIIEAMEGRPAYPIFSVQWHPEKMAVRPDQQMQRLFHYFVNEAKLFARAKNFHEQQLVVDSHCDTPMKFTEDFDFSLRHNNVKVDLPKMQEGLEDAVFMVAYLHQEDRDENSLQAATQKAIDILYQIAEQAKRMRDAVKLSFPVEPARPWLREYFTTSMQPGMVLRPQDFVTLKFKPGTNMKIHFSTHPLAAAAGSLDYLFRYPYGCTEQLSSALLPWLLADDLKDLPGFSLPEGDKPDKVIAKTLAKIRERRVTPGRVSGFRYWEGSRGASAEFTPYVLMVLQVAEKHGYRMNDLEKSMLDSLGLAVRGSDAKGNMISLLPLALSGKLSSSKLDEVLKTHQAMQEDAIWMAACAAAIIGDPRAASLADRARAAHDKPEIAPGVKGRVTPTVEQLRLRVPCEVLSLLYRHYRNPDDAALLTDAATVVRERSRGYMSTWECGWNCILIDALLDHQRALSAKSAASAAQTNGGAASLNGQQLRPGELLSVDASLYLSEGDYEAEGGTVYAYGTAEGYMADEQPDQPIDHGFATTRSYEVLQEDGSWKPTLQFRVGDIVRISIRCRYTGEAPARYVAIEDRLPAVMEAVDQSSPTQALPAHIMNKARRNLGWYAPYSVSSSEIGKDRMRFYVDKWGESDVTIRYVARVVRAGEVTAPAAKAEMMYSPQFYGLSTPEKLSVEPVK